jgi:hypothetical protein
VATPAATLNVNARPRVKPEWSSTAKSPTCCGTAMRDDRDRGARSDAQVGQESRGE